MRGLLTVGFTIILAGFAFLAIGMASQGGVSTGGVIFLGPIPIVFGSGQSGAELALISVVIGAIMLGLTLLWVRGRRTSG